MGSLNLSPTDQDKFRSHSVKPLNFAQRFCPSCKTRRSVGQFNRNPEVCDRCFNRGAKAG